MKRNVKFKVGIGIICLSFILSLNPYILIFIVPIFIIGVILIWFSSKKISTKVLWSFLPILLWYPTWMLYMYLIGTIGTATAQKLDFIFPENFRGEVVLVGNIPCGQKIILKEDREQLQVPKNGIILYQNEIKTGYVNHRYYIKENGSVIQLPERFNYMYFDGEENPPSKSETGVWLGSTGNKTSYIPKPKIEYKSMHLTVSSKDNIGKFSNFKESNKFEQLTDSLVRDCVKKQHTTSVTSQWRAVR